MWDYCMLLVTALISSCFITPVESFCKRPNGCTDPCSGKVCHRYPGARCIPYYCMGRCDHIFYADGRRVLCHYPTTTLSNTPAPKMKQVCPEIPPGFVGSCHNYCYRCEYRKMLCCPNGCGTLCKIPDLIPDTGNSTDLHNHRQELTKISGNCPKLPPSACFPPTINCERECPLRRQLCCPNGCGGYACMKPSYGDG